MTFTPKTAREVAAYNAGVDVVCKLIADSAALISDHGGPFTFHQAELLTFLVCISKDIARAKLTTEQEDAL